MRLLTLVLLLSAPAFAVNQNDFDQMVQEESRKTGGPSWQTKAGKKAKKRRGGCQFSVECGAGQKCMFDPYKQHGVCVAEDAEER